MRDIRVMNFIAGQQIESDEVIKRLGELEYRNHGSHAKIGLFNEGKALITEGLRVEAGTGMAVNVTAGNLFQRGVDVIGCIQKDDIPVTMDAASGAPRIDIVECQIITAPDKTDFARIGTVATGTELGSVIITNEEIKRDIKVYLTARKKTGSTTPTAATAAVLNGTVAIPATIDLSEKYLIHVSDKEDGDWVEIDCRGTTPNATTRAEIIAALNAGTGRTFATAGSGDTITANGDGTGISSYFAFKPPVTDVEADALEEIFGLSSGGSYKYEYHGTNGWIKIAEIDIGASTTTITNALIRNIDQKDTWASEADEVIVKDPVFLSNEPDWNEWSDIRTYDAGEIAYIGDQQFVSLQGSNLDKDPLFELDYWLPAPTLNEVLRKFHKAEPERGGMHDIHNIRDAGYKQFFTIGKYKLRGRTLEAYGVHIDGTVVTGDTDLESIFRVDETDEYPFLDLMAPDSMGTRTLLNYQGRVPRAVTSASGGTGDSLAVSLVQEDQFQAWQLGQIIGGTTYYSTGSANEYEEPVSFANYSRMLQRTVAQGEAEMGKAVNDGTNGTPRTGLETRMKNWAEGVPYLVVVKDVTV
jgi:hypothetical protein